MVPFSHTGKVIDDAVSGIRGGHKLVLRKKKQK